jgi:hypothetical protein
MMMPKPLVYVTTDRLYNGSAAEALADRHGVALEVAEPADGGYPWKDLGGRSKCQAAGE